MKCTGCGFENAQDAVFCEKCGNALVSISTQSQNTGINQVNDSQKSKKEKKKKKEKKGGKGKNKWIVLAVVIGVIICAIAALTATGIAGRAISNVTAGTFIESDESKKIEEHYQDGLACMENEEYSDAIIKFAKVPNSHRRYTEAQKNSDICSQRYTEDLISKIESCGSKEEFESAFAILSAANENALQDDFDLQEEIANLKSEYEALLVDEINSLKGEQNFTEALNLIASCNRDLLPEDTEIDTHKTSIENDYRETVLTQAEEMLKSEGYEKAIECLRNSHELLPNDKVIQEKISEYAQYQPVALYDLDYFDASSGSAYKQTPDYKINDGTEHLNGIEMSTGWKEDKWAEFKIDGAYTSFTGTLALDYYNRTSKGKNIITVYGDDVLLYTSPTFTGGVEPEPFNINISGVSKLKIVCAGTQQNTGTTVFFVDAYLNY